MIELGKQFVVMGDWDTSPEPEGKIVIRMPVAPPGVWGFWQDATRNCIEALEERIKPGMSFLDFGTGDGILLIVAEKLGAAPVYATENVVKVATFAQQVWDLNGVQAELLGEDLPEVDLCVANIGDQLWDIRQRITAMTLITFSNKGGLVVVNA